MVATDAVVGIHNFQIFSAQPGRRGRIMFKSVCLILLLSTAASATARNSSNVSCTAVGSWGCAADGACIETVVHRGERYRIDFKRMIIGGPRGRFSMRLVFEVDDRKEWQLDSGGHLSSMGRLEHPGNKKRDYDRYWLFNSDKLTSPIEIWCPV